MSSVHKEREKICTTRQSITRKVYRQIKAALQIKLKFTICLFSHSWGYRRLRWSKSTWQRTTSAIIIDNRPRYKSIVPVWLTQSGLEWRPFSAPLPFNWIRMVCIEAVVCECNSATSRKSVRINTTCLVFVGLWCCSTLVSSPALDMNRDQAQI